jgi:hypothetical protein
MPDSLFIEFPPVSTKEWEAAARLDLKGKDPAALGKILYRAEDWAGGPEQPWPARPWHMWADVVDLAGAKRAIDCGAEGLVVANPDPAWADVLKGIHLHTTASEAHLLPWASELAGTIEAETVSNALPHFRRAWAIEASLSISEQIGAARAVPDGVEFLLVPVSPSYFQEIAKLRALRRIKAGTRLVARTSAWHATAYDPHVNLLRATTEAMAAIIGGCDALIVGAFTEARGVSDEFAERLALNTQLLLRDESYFGCVADPAAGSWYIESLTEQFLNGKFTDKPQTAFVGVNRHPNPKEARPASVTSGRAMSALEQCRLRSDRAARRPTVRLIPGSNESVGRARAAFARDFFMAGGFAVSTSDDADLAVLCDADENYAALAGQVDCGCPLLAAGPEGVIAGVSGFINRQSDHARTIAEWQDRLGI